MSVNRTQFGINNNRRLNPEDALKSVDFKKLENEKIYELKGQNIFFTKIKNNIFYSDNPKFLSGILQGTDRYLNKKQTAKNSGITFIKVTSPIAEKIERTKEIIEENKSRRELQQERTRGVLSNDIFPRNPITGKSNRIIGGD